MSWTDDRVSLLTKLWKEGKTAKEIADTLGEGVTRNAVIGKAHRLNLSGRASPIQKDKKALSEGVAASNSINSNTAKKSSGAGQSAAKAPANTQANAQGKKSKKTFPEPANKNMKVEKPASKSAPEGGYQLSDLKDRMCRWPSGDPKEDDFHFCGEQIVPGLPYCEEHVKAAYQTNKKTKILNPDAFEPAERSEDDDQSQSLA